MRTVARWDRRSSWDIPSLDGSFDARDVGVGAGIPLFAVVLHRLPDHVIRLGPELRLRPVEGVDVDPVVQPPHPSESWAAAKAKSPHTVEH